MCIDGADIYFTEPWTPYWEHVKEGWENRKHENVLFTFYEDINDVNLIYFK